MTKVQKAVFPGLMVGILFLIFFTGLLASPVTPVQADQPQATNSQAQSAQKPSNTSQPKAANNAANTGASSNSSGCSLGSAFPENIRQWCDLIEKYSSQYGVDPNLVASVMLQESGGNANAVSKSGAIGLLQVMPSDGIAAGFQCINGPCFASRPSTQELTNPDFNIDYGVRMLAGLIQKYGDVREALRAYGPMDMGYSYADLILSILNRYK